MLKHFLVLDFFEGVGETYSICLVILLARSITAKFKMFHNSIRLKIVSLSHNKTKFIMFNFTQLDERKIIWSFIISDSPDYLSCTSKEDLRISNWNLKFFLSSLDNIKFQHPSQVLVITLNLLDL